MQNGCYFYFAHIYSKIHTELLVQIYYTPLMTLYWNWHGSDAAKLESQKHSNICDVKIQNEKKFTPNSSKD
jgi:hypothetical protein